MTNVEKFCNNAVIFCYCALIYFLPISIALVESFAAGVIFFYVVKKIASGKLKPRGGLLSAAIAANILIVFISVFFSKFFAVSMYAFFAKFLEGCFLYYAFVECFERKKHIQFFMGAMAVSAVVICLSGLNQYFNPNHYDFVRGTLLEGGRMSSTFRNANDFGAYLIPVTALITAFFFTCAPSAGPWQKYKFVLAVMAALPLICLGLTYSRSTWLGFFAAAVLTGLMCKRLVHSILLIVLFLAVFSPLMMSQRNVSFISDDLRMDKRDVQVIVDSGQKVEHKSAGLLAALKADVQARLRIIIEKFGGMGRSGFWEEAVDIIRQFPFFGTGLNTYSKIAPGYKLSWGGYPHNCYLQMAAEIGMIGLISFLMMVGILFFRTLKAVIKMRDPFLKSVVSGACAGLLGFLIQSCLDTTLYSVQLANFMWILMGLIVAAIAVDGKLAKQYNGKPL